MASVKVVPESREWTVADLAERFGSLPARRVRTSPPPGTATEADMERVRRETGHLCEIIDGTLVEKLVSDYSSILAAVLIRLLGNFVAEHRLGWIHAPDGYFWLSEQLRAPDVSFTRRDQRTGGPLRRGYSDVAPALAAEILSPGNTAAEMLRKRREFFAHGTQMFWMVDPIARTVEVYTNPDTADARLTVTDTLSGGAMLPGFELRIREFFDAAELPDAQ